MSISTSIGIKISISTSNGCQQPAAMRQRHTLHWAAADLGFRIIFRPPKMEDLAYLLTDTHPSLHGSLSIRPTATAQDTR